jgi:hypothetical protein
MIKKHIVGIVFLLFSSVATATTIDFTSGSYNGVGSLYIEDGFSFTTPAGNHTDCIDPTSGGYCWHDGGGNPVFENNVTLSFGGAQFSLNSIETIFFASSPTGDNNGLTLSSISGGVPVNLNLAPNDYNVHGVTGFDNVTFVTLSLPNLAGFFPGEIEIDNVIVSAVPIPAVPVPAAIWLFGTALIGLVGFGKRRKAA